MYFNSGAGAAGVDGVVAGGGDEVGVEDGVTDAGIVTGVATIGLAGVLITDAGDNDDHR